MFELQFDIHKCMTCRTCDCLTRCQYMDIDADSARKEMRKIYNGRDSFVLHNCATCYACEEYCKMGNHPFYLIVEKQEELDIPPLPQPLIKRGVQMGIPFRGEPEIEEIEGPVINLGAFSPLTHLIRGRLFEGLSTEALDWTPGPDMNSLGVLAIHVAGAERYWIGDVVGRDPSDRDRSAEFRARGLDAAALKAHLAETLVHSQGVLEGLALPDLEASRVSPRNGREFTVAWCLAHALEHTALHLGHMQITRQLWEQGRI